MSFAVTIDTASLNDTMRNLGQKALKAEVRALNRTIAGVNTLAKRTLAAETGLTASTVGKGLRITRATWSRREAKLRATYYPIPLYKFTGQRAKRGRPTGAGAVDSDAFIARVTPQKIGIFIHKGTALSRKGMPSPSPQLRIEELFGPSLAEVFVSGTIRATLVANAETLLQKNLTHELAFLDKSA